MLTLTGVEKCYGRVQALAPVDFVAERGALVFIAGANGCGKSTLLRIIARISLPTRGCVSFAPEAGAVVYVPQSGGFYPQLTLSRHLEIWRWLYDRSAQPDAAMTEAVHSLGLGTFLHRPLSTLSGGYQKLAVLACAFGVAPSILLLDEPFSGLDKIKAQAISDLISVRSTALDLLVVAGHEPEPLLGDAATVLHLHPAAER